MKGSERRLIELRAAIPEVTPAEARERQAQGAFLIDVREPDEVAQGSPPGAQRIVRGFLELRVEDAVPDKEAPVCVMCAGGVRSLFAAEGLRQLGYARVSSVAGGFNRWPNEGLPVEVPVRSSGWRIWRWRLLRSTTSMSTMPSFPTPAAAK